MATQIYAANDKLHNQVITCNQPRDMFSCLKLYTSMPILDIVDAACRVCDIHPTPYSQIRFRGMKRDRANCNPVNPTCGHASFSDFI